MLKYVKQKNTHDKEITVKDKKKKIGEVEQIFANIGEYTRVRDYLMTNNLHHCVGKYIKAKLIPESRMQSRLPSTSKAFKCNYRQ